ncbi:MAG: glycosyltransferase family 4 protein, partial [Methanosarcinales archaeon]
WKVLIGKGLHLNIYKLFLAVLLKSKGLKARNLNIINKILFLGFISEEEKIAAYDAADVVVVPSIGEFTEGFSIVLSEAWARGKTVVVTPSRALRSRVKHGTGYIADYNPSSFSKALIKALENPTKSPKVYSWREVVDMIERLYFKILI